MRPRRVLAACAVDRRPLADPAFRRLWLAAVVVAVGGSFTVVAIPAQLYAVTGSSAVVGASSAVSFAALVVSSLWTGAAADVRDRRRILLAAHCALALTYTALWTHAALGGRSIPVLLALVACQGLGYGAVMTTMGAAVPRLVPANLFPAANSLNALVRYTGSVLGPLLAGILIPVVGPGTLYLCDALALSAVIRAVVRLPALPPGAHTPARGPVLRRLAAGFRYLAASRLLVAVLAVDLAAMLFGMPVALFPELARHAYGDPAGGGPVLGLLYAAYPAGVCAVGLLSGLFTRAVRHGALMAGAAGAWGVTVVVFGLAPGLWIALPALVLGGAVNFVLSTFRTSLTQALTDDAVRGRVQGSLTVVLIGGPQLANLLHGATAPLLGARTVICAGGLLTTATVAAIAWAVPELRRYSAAYGRSGSPAPSPGRTARARTPQL